MNHFYYLKSIMSKRSESWSKDLNKIILSKSLRVGTPYNSVAGEVLSKYIRRNLGSNFNKKKLGIDELIKTLEEYPRDYNVMIYPIMNDFFSGDCVVDNEIIGCALIERGGSFSMEGLWLNGRRIN